MKSDFFKSNSLKPSINSMIIQNNVTVVVRERHGNQEQHDLNWSEKEKCIIKFALLLYWSLIGIAILCYIKFHQPIELELDIYDEFGMLNYSQICPNGTIECIERVALANSLYRLTVRYQEI